MKKTIIILLMLVISIGLYSCGNNSVLDGKTYRWEEAGFIVLELSFKGSTVVRSGVILPEGANEKGSYEMDDNEISITWEDGYDNLTYDPDTDTLFIGDSSVVFTRVEK